MLPINSPTKEPARAATSPSTSSSATTSSASFSSASSSSASSSSAASAASVASAFSSSRAAISAGAAAASAPASSRPGALPTPANPTSGGSSAAAASAAAASGSRYGLPPQYWEGAFSSAAPHLRTPGTPSAPTPAPYGDAGAAATLFPQWSAPLPALDYYGYYAGYGPYAGYWPYAGYGYYAGFGAAAAAAHQQVHVAPLGASAPPAPVGYQWHVAEMGGQPYVFALPAPALFATPLPVAPGGAYTSSGGTLRPEEAAALATTWPPPGLAATVAADAARGAGAGAGRDAAAQAAAEQQPAGAAEGGAGRGAAAAAAAAVHNNMAGGAAGGVAIGAGGGLGGVAFDGEDDEGRTDALRLVLKLAFFVYLLGQDGNMQRSILLSLAAVIIFLAQMGWLTFFNRFAEPHGPAVRAANNPPAQRAAAAEADAASEGGTDAAAEDADGVERPAVDPVAEEEETRWVALYRDGASIVSAFFASLLPSFRAHDANADPDWEQMPADPM